ncbi:MAG: arginyltransferase [Bdellovibrionales bacterium]
MSDSNNPDILLPEAYISQPAPCPYLPNRNEQRILLPLAKDNAVATEQLSFFTRLGFRRTQQFMYRPNCQTCQACISYRVIVKDFKPSVTQARIARRNKDLWWQKEESPNLLAMYALFLRYQQTRHAASEMAKFSYTDFLTLVDEPSTACGIYTLSRSTQDYMGAMLVDRVEDGLSAVYSFFDPEARVRSLGTALILRLIEEAVRQRLPYVYLGYWVKDSLKMEYKSRFGPAEILTENGWMPFGN